MTLRFLAILLVLLSPVIAKPSKGSKPSGGGLSLQFLTEQTCEKPAQVLLSFGEAKSKSFALPSTQLSEPIAVTARVMVLKSVEDESPLCTITLPEAGNAFVVLLLGEKAAGFTQIIVRSDDPAFKAGDVFFVNRTGKTVIGKLGETQLELKPGETSKNRPSGAGEKPFYNITFATHENDEEKLFHSSRWPVDRDLRSYIFFSTNAKGRHTYRAVDENLTPKRALKR
jgi:hypothetical protein